MDRLERFMASELVMSLGPSSRASIRLAGVLLPMLLFADDIVLLSRDRAVLQRMLDVLARFCRENGLTVNTGKTKWLVGGAIPVGFEFGELRFGDVALERVAVFKYLGLEFDGSGTVR